MKRFLIRSAIVAAVLLALALIGTVLLWRASQSVPDFYTQALDLTPGREREGSDSLLQKASLLAGDVRKTGKWEGLFTEDEINGWLAVDLPENHQNTLPPRIANPRVAIERGGLRLAFRARRGRFSAVICVELDLYLAEPNVIGLRIRGVRAGSLPLPLAEVLEPIRAAGERHDLRIRWQQADGDPVALIRLDPLVKNKKPVVVETLELADGEIYVAGETEERPKVGVAPAD